jgi:hypothetical protein
MFRKAYLLTTNKHSKRCIFSKNTLENIGFNVILIQHIPNVNKVLSNKLSMQYIYNLIMNGDEQYSYVFEDDINIIKEIKLNEIIEYEYISKMFFYLGGYGYGNFKQNLKKTEFIINNNDVYSISGCVRGLHAIGLSKIGAEYLLNFSKNSEEQFMDVILENFSYLYPANIVRADLKSYLNDDFGIIFQDRNQFPSEICPNR